MAGRPAVRRRRAAAAAMAERRPLLLCADDFGLRPGVDEAIAGLVGAGRLNAVSCLVNAPAWRADAQWVVELRRGAQVGLHLNLTEGAPLSAALSTALPAPTTGPVPLLPALPWLIAATHLQRLPAAALAEELHAQWQAFVAATGTCPDFIDGHQHVHHLPGVRQAVLALAAAQRVPVRNTGAIGGPGFAIKRALIAGSGGVWLQRALRRQALPHNGLLLGVYDFIDTDYRGLMRGWLARVPAAGALLFCHPGRAEADAAPQASADPIAAARLREYTYLASDDFARDLAAAGVALGGWMSDER